MPSAHLRLPCLVAALLAASLPAAGTGRAAGPALLAERPEQAGDREADGGRADRLDLGGYPPPGAGFVTDLANLLPPDAEERIERLLRRVDAERGVQIVVVTLGSIQDYPGTANGSIEAFATDLFNRYRIGTLPHNTGVLLLVAKRDHRMRIELGAGWGRNRDADAARIIDRTLRPRFKAERYATGIEEGVQAIVKEFGGMGLAIPSPLSALWNVVAAILVAVVGVALAVSLIRNGKTGWGWLVLAVVGAMILAVFRGLQQIGERSGSSDGGWFDGGFGGDSGGFGGGFSDGGGSSGDW